MDLPIDGVATRTNEAVATGAPASRATGAIVGAAIAVAAALVAAPLGSPFLALGIPAATASGWLLGPRIRPAESIVDPALRMAAVTVVVADAFLMLASMVLSIVRVDPYGGTTIVDAIGGSLFLFTVGLVIVGIPMLLITVPCGLAWAGLVRSAATWTAS
jgi:hypothetical protein